MQVNIRRRIGLALGGGGARGLAHISMLEVLDELRVRPSMVTGTSIGAIAGGLFAAGLSAQEIKDRFAAVIPFDPESSLLNRAASWLQMASVESGPGLINVDAFFEALFEPMMGMQFADLAIPLKVVSTDFWRREQVVLSEGDVVSAIRASMALPGIFRPESKDGRVLVDGGCVNPVPFDLLDDCEVTIAINVLGERDAISTEPPGLFDAVFQTYQIMETAIVTEKLTRCRPSIFLSPEITDIRMLDFHKADSIFRQAVPAQQQLKREISALLD